MHHYGIFRRLLGCGAGEVGAMTRWGEIKCPRCAELEAKLAKAVDIDMIEQAISDVLSEGGTYRDAAEYVAQTTLAELKGQGE